MIPFTSTDSTREQRLVAALVVTVAVLLSALTAPDDAGAAAADWNCDDIELTMNGDFRAAGVHVVGPAHIETSFTGTGTGVCSRTTGPTASSPWTEVTLSLSGEAALEGCAETHQMYTYQSSVTITPSNGEPAFTTTIDLDLGPSTTNEGTGEIALGSGQTGTVTWRLQPSDPTYPGRCDRDMTELRGSASFRGVTATDRVVQDETTPPPTPGVEGTEAADEVTETPTGGTDINEDVVPAGTGSFSQQWEFPVETLEESSGDSAAAGPTVATCRISLGVDGFIRYAPNPNRAGFHWSGKMTCYGSANVGVIGGSSVYFARNSQYITAGDPCQVSNNGFPCRTRGGYIAPNTKKHYYLIRLHYYRVGPPGTRWRPTPNDTNGIDQKVCTGYGSNSLNCNYYRHFAVGIG